MSQWQPIETAVGQNGMFLVWREGMSMSTAFYMHHGQEKILEINSKGYWPKRPTHWMPLPAPPS